MLNIEPLNSSYDEQEVCAAIGTALTDFYTALTRTLDNIDVDKILKRKNLRPKSLRQTSQKQSHLQTEIKKQRIKIV